MTIRCLGCDRYITLLAPLGDRGKFGRCECNNRADLVPRGGREVCQAADLDLVVAWDRPRGEFVQVRSLTYLKPSRSDPFVNAKRLERS